MSQVIVLLADGLRPDSLRAAMERGDVPALAALRAEGALHTVTTAFPSVTGVAYSPFLLGRFPGAVGLVGLRWYDRTRRIGPLAGHARSYVGVDMCRLDSDLDPLPPTVFELLPNDSLGALSVIERGLPPGRRVARGASFAARAAWTHVLGRAAGWLAIDRDVGDALVARIRRERPRFVFAAFGGIDKASHAAGHDAPLARGALAIVDSVAARIRADAERDGRWRDLRLWVTSDHGHAPLTGHDDLARAIASLGFRVRAHPFVARPGGDVAVMVSGNAMAHVYVELARRQRPGWAALRDRWDPLARFLLEREAVDLVLLAHMPSRIEVRSRQRGSAVIERRGDRFSYLPADGDPLDLGLVENQCAAGAWEATAHGDYPDAIVQIACLAGAARAGDIILSASPGWDFRDRYEPIPHRSSHGSLRRDHACVPLLIDQAPARAPRRTADVMPAALHALGVPVPPGLDGATFL
jgi:hypothetical protein